MATLKQLLEKYGESHRNPVNKAIHWICVPVIMFSLCGLLMAIPVIFIDEKTIVANWGTVAFCLAWFYYLRFSRTMFLSFVLISLLIIRGNFAILEYSGSDSGLALVSLVLFVIAWIGQFIGHAIEGKKPSFLQDIQFLLIGPAWLLHFLFDKANLRY